MIRRNAIISLFACFIAIVATGQELLVAENEIWVVAHRGDWRNAPENSIPAIKRSIQMDVDMVEFDIQQTKDGQFILMHDKSLDRTTNGSGKVSEMTLEEINELVLLNGYGLETNVKVPTLKEALIVCKGRIRVFVDKGYEYIGEVHKLAEELGMEQQVYFEGKVSPSEISTNYPQLVGVMNYMPRMNHKTNNPSIELDQWLVSVKPELVIVTFEDDEDVIIDLVKDPKNINTRFMAVPLWDNGAGGHTDDLSVENPEEGWGWLVDKGFRAICTDRPVELLNYLRIRGKHN